MQPSHRNGQARQKYNEKEDGIRLLRIIDEPVRSVLIDHLKTVVGRNGDGIDHRRMHAIRNGFSVRSGCSLTQINPN